jgi:hypothetical protein
MKAKKVLHLVLDNVKCSCRAASNTQFRAYPGIRPDEPESDFSKLQFWERIGNRVLKDRLRKTGGGGI